MKAVFSFALAAVVVAAQSTTTATAAGSGSTCAAEYIVQACLDTENAQFSGCGINDWDCKCNAYANIVACYNNCPGDAALNQAQGQQQIFCGYASQYPSTTLGTGTGTAQTTAKATAKATATDAEATDTPDPTATGTATTGTAKETAKANSGSDRAMNAGVLLAAVAGVVAAML